MGFLGDSSQSRCDRCCDRIGRCDMYRSGGEGRGAAAASEAVLLYDRLFSAVIEVSAVIRITAASSIAAAVPVSTVFPCFPLQGLSCG